MFGLVSKILAGLLLAALVAVGVQSWRVKHLKSELTGYKAAVTQFEAAQKTNLDTITTLQSANAAWSDLLGTKKGETAAALARLDVLSRQITELNTQKAELRRALAKKDPLVADYLRTGVPAPLACQLWPSTCENADD